MAVVTLLAIWVVMTLVIPNVGWLVAKQLVNVPSHQQFKTEKFKTAREIEDEAEKINPSDSDLPGYGKLHPEVQPKIAETLREMDNQYAQLWQKRLDLSFTLTRFLPVGAYVYTTTGLTQTGIADEHHYHSQLQQNRSVLASELQEFVKVAYSSFSEIQQQYDSLIAPHVWRGKIIDLYVELKGIGRSFFERPLAFTFDKLSLSQTLNAIRLDLLVLTVWVGLTFALAMLAFTTGEVRQ